MSRDNDSEIFTKTAYPLFIHFLSIVNIIFSDSTGQKLRDFLKANPENVKIIFKL